ncbi:hypothetical protein [Sulfuricurvum sp.]|uniref:hypothetical protein n=1 Tax=Sulfuricurvum sp. TaxID=2025608 RepID=UPI00356151D4
MKFSEATNKICPFMSARFNLAIRGDYGIPDNKPNIFNCSVSRCMSWVTTKTYISIRSQSALYDEIGDELPFSDKEGYCILLERYR